MGYPDRYAWLKQQADVEKMLFTSPSGTTIGKGGFHLGCTGTSSLNSPDTNRNQPHGQLARVLSYPEVCKRTQPPSLRASSARHNSVPAWIRTDILAVWIYLVNPSQHFYPKRAPSLHINLGTAFLSPDISGPCGETQERSWGRRESNKSIFL